MADGIGFKSEFTYSSAPPSDNHPSMYLPGEYPSAPHPIPCFEQPYPQVPQPPLPTYPTNCFPEESKPVFALFPHIDYPTPSHPQEDSDITAGGHKAYYWIDWSSDRMVPPTAVHGGVDKDGSQIYVGRAYHEGDWIPAKVIPERHTAYVAYGGGEHSKDTFQILCEQRFDWVPTSSGHIPSGAVEGGRTQSGEPYTLEEYGTTVLILLERYTPVTDVVIFRTTVKKCPSVTTKFWYYVIDSHIYC